MSTAVIPSSYLQSTGSRWVELLTSLRRFVTGLALIGMAANRAATKLESLSRSGEADALRAQALREFANDPAFQNDLFAAADRHELGERA